MLKKLIPIFVLLILSVLILSACSDKCEHNYIETIIPSTCKNNGYTQRLCTGCGDEQIFDYKPLSGHSGEWYVAKEPTCQTVGTEERLCLTCNTIFETRSITKLGHVSGEWKTTKAPTCKNTGEEKLFCNTCGIDLETRVLAVTEEHDFFSEVTPPTISAEGYTTYTCKICDFSKKDDYVPKIEVIEELSASEIYELASKAMVRIDAYDKNGKRFSLGSGFFISNDGKIATNYHVIQGAYSLKAVLYYDNSTHNVTTVLGYNSARDVAVIQINLTNTSHLELSTDEVKTGDTVYTLGSPMGIDNIFSSGIVSNPSKKVSGNECIAFTAPISSGNSGGPLLNNKGQVIGINTMTVTDSQSLNFAVMAKQITNLNTENAITPSALYNKTISENAFELLYLNIMLNAQSVSNDQYIIYTNTPETADNVGTDTYFIADSEKETVTIRTHIVKNGKRLYTTELVLRGVSEKYLFTLYDISLGQYGIESTVNAKSPAKSYEADYEALFNIVTFRYTDTDKVPAENMRQVYFLMYTLTMESLSSYLNRSNTGLNLAHFNFNY